MNIPMWAYSRRHPDCRHCVTIAQVIAKWPKETHLTCPCACHNQMKDWYTNGPVKGRKRRATKQT